MTSARAFQRGPVGAKKGYHSALRCPGMLDDGAKVRRSQTRKWGSRGGTVGAVDRSLNSTAYCVLLRSARWRGGCGTCPLHYCAAASALLLMCGARRLHAGAVRLHGGCAGRGSNQYCVLRTSPKCAVARRLWALSSTLLCGRVFPHIGAWEAAQRNTTLRERKGWLSSFLKM